MYDGFSAHLRDLEYPSLDLGWQGRRCVIRLKTVDHESSTSDASLVVPYFRNQGWVIPRQERQEQALGSEELNVRVFEVGRQILTSEIEEKVNEYCLCLSDQSYISLKAW